MGTIYAELKQPKPFELLEREAIVTVLRTADVLHCQMERALKPWEISPEQYNILRILRGAPDGSHPTLEVASRMISRGPNITRLIDKLVDKGLARRDRAGKDRRVVRVRITPAGRRVIQKAAPDLEKITLADLRGVSRKAMKTAIGALDRIRANVGP